MSYPMSAFILMTCLFVPLSAQESKPHLIQGKALHQRIDGGPNQSGHDQTEELRAQLRDLQEMMERFRGQLDGLGDFAGPDSFRGSSSRIRIDRGSGGVKVELRSLDQDGDDNTKVYAAPDMDSFRKKFPDIAERFFKGGQAFTFQPHRFGFDLDDLPFARFPHVGRGSKVRILPSRITRMPAKGEQLGIYVGNLAPEIGAFLGFEHGQGLLVDSVVGDSLAAALGIEAGDVVYQIDATKIFSTTDVAHTLGAIHKGATLTVKVNRKGRDLELEAEKLATAENGKLKQPVH